MKPKGAIFLMLAFLLAASSFNFHRPVPDIKKIRYVSRSINQPFYAIYLTGRAYVVVSGGEERKISYPKGSSVEFKIDIVDLHLKVSADTVFIETPEYQEISFYRVDSNVVLLLADTLHIPKLDVETYGNARVILFGSPDMMMLQTYQKDNSVVKVPGAQIVGAYVTLSDKAVFDASDCKIQTGLTVELGGQSIVKVYTDGMIEGSAEAGTKLFYKGEPYISINGSPELVRVK